MAVLSFAGVVFQIFNIFTVVSSEDAYPERQQSERGLLSAYQTFREPLVVTSPVRLFVDTAELKETDFYSSDSNVELQSWLTRAYGFYDDEGVRHEPSIPGPTIRVKPGEFLQIRVDNNLDQPNPNCTETYRHQHGNLDKVKTIINGNCHINGTNLHTHGLHVTPNDPGDDVLDHWKPGQPFYVNVTLPANHAPGTYWYHPHRHHSTAAQAGDGMHGALIVDDPQGSMPPEYESMPEKVVVLSVVDMRYGKHSNSDVPLGGLPISSSDLENLSDGKLWKDQTGQYVDKDLVYVLVNGMLIPKLELVDGQWTRFRFIFASVELTAMLTVPDIAPEGFQCEIRLLAKDGNYLKEIPRKLTDDSVFLASGNRADVAIRCSCVKEDNCEGSILASAKSGDAPGFVEGAPPLGEYLRSNVEKCMSGAKKGCLASGTLGKHNVGPFSGVGQDPVQQELIHVRVVPNRMERRRDNSFNLKGSFTEALAAVHSFWESTSLPRFRAPTPCYVVDLQGVSDVQQGILSLPQPSGDTNPPWQVVYWSDESAPENYTGKPMRDETDFPPLHIMDIGTVQELRFNGPPTGENSSNSAYEIGGIRDHPIHIHVAPFQIRKLRCKDGSWVGEPGSPQGCDGSNYFMTGDWHDTLMDSGGQAIVRMQLSDFAGKYVVHCHILAHEDEGMMAYFQVRGEDGTQWPGVHNRSCVKNYSAEHPRYILLDSEGN